MSYCEAVKRRLPEIRGQVVPSSVDGMACNMCGGPRALVRLSEMDVICVFLHWLQRGAVCCFTSHFS